MKDVETKEKFIQLRAEGKSYESIAQKINVSKRTLINWSSDLAHEIARTQELRTNGLYEQYYLSIEAKVKLWGNIVNEIQSELAERDLSTVDTDKLLAMLIRAQGKLEAAYILPVIPTDIDESENGEERKYNGKYKGYVYIIKSGKLFKIGRTRNPQNRLASYRTQNPYPIRIVILASVPDDKTMEKRLMSLVSSKCYRGEWFDLDNEDIDMLTGHIFNNGGIFERKAMI